MNEAGLLIPFRQVAGPRLIFIRTRFVHAVEEGPVTKASERLVELAEKPTSYVHVGSHKTTRVYGSPLEVVEMLGADQVAITDYVARYDLDLPEGFS